MRFKLRYNTRAKIWKETGLNSFKNTQFYLASTSNKLEPVTTTSGKYYPVRDACQKDGDPEEGCLTTEALYYRISASLPEYTTTRVILLGPSEELIADDTYQNSYVKTYNTIELECDDDKSKCLAACTSKGGSWNQLSRICSVDFYLVGFCYRVIKENDRWGLDIPA